MSANSFAIRMLTPDDAQLFAEHIARNVKTSGVGDTPIFAVRSRHVPFDVAVSAARSRKHWNIPVGNMGWERNWGVVVDTSEGQGIVAAVSLTSTRNHEKQMHRATLGMGIKEEY